MLCIGAAAEIGRTDGCGEVAGIGPSGGLAFSRLGSLEGRADDHDFRPIEVVAQHQRASSIDHPGHAEVGLASVGLVSGRNTKGPQALIIRALRRWAWRR